MIYFIIQFINVIYNKLLSYSFEIYNRLFLRNNIDPKIIKIIKDGQKQYNKEDLLISDINDVKIYKKNNIESFIIEVFFIDNNNNNFNVKEDLYIIKGYSINNINNISNFNLKNSDDLGEIIPQNTNNYHF